MTYPTVPGRFMEKLMLTKLLLISLFVACLVGLAAAANAARPGVNYDEAKVPHYTLPDPLVTRAGKKVADADTWAKTRRPEVLELFRTHMFGRSPGRPKDMSFHEFDHAKDALNGKAVRRQVTVRLAKDADGPSMDILLYLPADADGPVPLFVGLNFRGNHAIHADPGIRLSTRWINPKYEGVEGGKATAAARGTAASRWPVETILARGYGLAMIYYGDIEPDRKDALGESVRALYLKPGQAAPAPDEWGAIGAWAWGLSRAMDYFETDKDIDAARVAVIGHSRLGKTALWAGATDERFAITISNDSGCGGAALSRRRFGEVVAGVNAQFPHWFCGNFHKYGGREDDLPLDQHMLIALTAPRPVYVASATGDLWADPRGEFLSCVHATPVYRLFGKVGLPTETMPGPGKNVSGDIGYHLRPGKHDLTAFDWARYLDFADKHMGKKR